MNSQNTIDLPTFECLKEAMGSDFIGELLQAYFDETPKLLTALEEAYDRRDCESFTRAAHSIKSTSNSFGALQFGLMARELEMIGKAGNLDDTLGKVEALKTNYDTVQKTLEDLSHGE